jgi:hypothetical protein
LNIASIPILIIVLRNNMIMLFSPSHFPSKEKPLTKVSFLYTVIIQSIVLTAVIGLKDQIQLVLFISGGLFGVLLSVSFPCLFVIIGRSLTKQKIQVILFTERKTTLFGFVNLSKSCLTLCYSLAFSSSFTIFNSLFKKSSIMISAIDLFF